jgi:hypothetical protein
MILRCAAVPALKIRDALDAAMSRQDMKAASEPGCGEVDVQGSAGA